MYTISYVDRTNVSLALDPSISKMMPDLGMDDTMKGHAAGIFFLGYVLLQIPGGHWAARWSARKVIALCLIAWGVCASACGLAGTFRQFEVARFCLGIAESAVFPATLVLVANWFSRKERARANAIWMLCQPLAIAGSAPVTTWLLGGWGWRTMLIAEGLLPIIWLPLWWFVIRDRPRDASWVTREQHDALDAQFQKEAAEMPAATSVPIWTALSHPGILVMIAMYFIQNSVAYGCMTFFTSTLKGRGFTEVQYGLLFALPYAITFFVMLLNSWHSDKTNERRGHVALVYTISGVSLILSVLFRDNFWLSFAFLCVAIPGPFAAMGPFWSLPGEMLPPAALAVAFGVVNACGNIGGYVGPTMVGWLKESSGSTNAPFQVLGGSLLVAAAMAFLLPRSARSVAPGAVSRS